MSKSYNVPKNREADKNEQKDLPIIGFTAIPGDSSGMRGQNG